MNPRFCFWLLASSPPWILPVASSLPHRAAPRRLTDGRRSPPTHSTWTRSWSSPPPPSLLPPPARSGAAELCGVAWTGDPAPSSVDQGAIRRRFGLGFTSPFLLLSLVRNRFIPLYLALRSGSALEKRSNLSLRPLLKTKRGLKKKNPPFPSSSFLFLHFVHFVADCVLDCEFLFVYLSKIVGVASSQSRAAPRCN